jgi:hypothetical protein
VPFFGNWVATAAGIAIMVAPVNFVVNSTAFITLK